MEEHLPQRPSWECRKCELPWPCSPAKKNMHMSTGAVTLAVLMWGYLEDFSIDAGPGPFDGAYERFMGWVRGPVAE